MGPAYFIWNFAFIISVASLTRLALADHNRLGTKVAQRGWQDLYKFSSSISNSNSPRPRSNIKKEPPNNCKKKCKSTRKPSIRKDVRAISQKFSSPQECARSCVAGQKPKTCYYHFTVEYYSTMSAACDMCRSNGTRLIDDCQCVVADGFEMSGIITANRMYPGPAIMVCLHDYIVVDVANHLPGSGITIHWHGLLQNGYQYYDGVPYVTQCPIQEGSTFRYQFRANNPGTHFWHAHTGFHKAEGLDGALIVREPRPAEPNNDAWDFDNYDNVIFLTDWLHSAAGERFPGNRVNRPGQHPDSFLINGVGRFTDPNTQQTTRVPYAVITVKRGYRHRFRMINACSMTCPLLLTVEGHDLTVIASDGELVVPSVVNSIVTFSAERYDFVINANKQPGEYWIQVRGLGDCFRRNLQQLAILRYEGSTMTINENRQPTYLAGLASGLVLNQLNVQCNGINYPPNTLCVSHLRNARHVDPKILKPVPDVKLFMPINFHAFTPATAFRPGTYKRYLAAGGDLNAGLMANITNVFPSSPLLTQRKDIPDVQVCSSKNLPPQCRNQQICECTHVEELPLGAVIEVILVDEAQVPGLSHPFHLHGHSFHIIGEGCASEYNITSIDVGIARDLDKRGQMYRHLARPPAKDTYAVPNNGFTIIRFIASNPGYWLFHCHYMFHLMAGMTSIFHVGETSDLPPIPMGFPQCGDFTPPIPR